MFGFIYSTRQFLKVPYYFVLVFLLLNFFQNCHLILKFSFIEDGNRI